MITHKLPIVFALAATVALTSAGAAFAQDGGPGAGASLVDVIYSIAEAFIKVIVGGSVAVFAASLARGTFSAQLANLVGSPLGMSQAWLNIVAGIFTFVLALLSPLVVDMVFNIVKVYASTTVSIPTLGG